MYAVLSVGIGGLAPGIASSQLPTEAMPRKERRARLEGAKEVDREEGGIGKYCGKIQCCAQSNIQGTRRIFDANTIYEQVDSFFSP